MIPIGRGAGAGKVTVCGAQSPDATLACELPTGHSGDHGAWTLEERQYAADAALGAAWRRCEAARLPSQMVTLQGYPDWHAPDYSAAVVIVTRLDATELVRFSGPTPTAALEALAEKLESLRP